MTRKTSLLVLFTLLAAGIALGQPMSGTYYIKKGVSRADTFPSFVAVANALQARGMGGNCTFLAFAGVYDEGIVYLQNIAGDTLYHTIFDKVPGQGEVTVQATSYAFYIYYHINTKIYNLTLRATSFGAYVFYSSNVKFEKCRIFGGSYGLMLYYASYDSVVKCWVNASIYGLYFYGSSSPRDKRNHASNNMVVGYSTGAIYSYYNDSLELYCNTFNSNATYTIFALYATRWQIRNNIFQTRGTYVYYFGTGCTLQLSNYNCLFNLNTGGSFAYYVTTAYANLAAWQAATGFDMNSISTDAQVGGGWNPHLRPGSPCIGAGSPCPGISDDFDGEARTIPWDIGADEYSAGGGGPMSGTYTIRKGFTGTDTFPGFFDAMMAVWVRGFAGNVTFNVSAGLYTEQLRVVDLNNGPYFLTFQARQSTSGPDEVTISAGAMYGIFLTDASKCRFTDLIVGGYTSYGAFNQTLTTTTPYKGCDTVTYRRCTFYGANAMYFHNGADDDSVIDCQLYPASTYGVYCLGTSLYPGSRAVFINNIIVGFTGYGIMATWFNNNVYYYNTIYSTTGIYPQYDLNFTGGPPFYRNNIWFNGNTFTGRYTLYTAAAVPTANVNYNCHWYPAGPNVAYIGAAYTWSSLRAAGFEANGINRDPLIGGVANPRLKTGSPCIDSAVAITGIPRDIDGDLRDSAPGPGKYDIGADEYTVAPGDPMSGVYTVKQEGGGDFRSVRAALGALALRGFAGDVRFDIYRGTYTGMIILTGIGNGSNWLTFRGVPGEDPVLFAGASYNFSMNANRRIRIEGLTLRGATSYAIFMAATTTSLPYQGCDTCIIRNNKIYGNMGIYCYYADYDTISDNLIDVSSSYGMFIYGYSSTPKNVGHVIERNTISNFSSYGIMTYYMDSLKIKHNTITGPIPIYINYDNYDTIACNVLNSTAFNYGLYVYGWSSSPYSQGIVIHNNMITNAYYGMMLYYTNGCKLIYNSVQCNPTSSFTGLYSYYNYALHMHNNIFTAQQYAMYYYPGDPFPATANYNNYRLAGGGTYVIYHGNYGTMDLATWKSTSGKDTNAISQDPLFVSTTDCHLQASSPCIDAGRAYPGITLDLDGDDRTLNTPDIGADERYGDLAVRSITAPVGAYPIGTDISPIASYQHIAGPRTNYYVYMSIFKDTSEVYRDSTLKNTRPGDSFDVTFRNWNASPGGTDYRAKAWHKFTPDLVPGNDTVGSAFVVGTIDIALTKILVPVGPYDTSLVIKPSVRVKNLGTLNPGAFKVFFMFESTPGNRVYFDSCLVPSLPPGESAVATALTNWAKPHKARAYTVTDWVNVNYDVDRANDTITGRFTVTSKQPGWYPMTAMPSGAKQIKDGGWLAYDPGGEEPFDGPEAGTGLIYAARGNKSPDFFSYNPAKDSWKALTSWPNGTEGKPPGKGSVGCADGNGRIYAAKGNNKLGWWEYDAATNAWKQLKDVPLGPSNKAIKGGSSAVWAYKGGVGNAYLLKGYKNEFFRYDPAADAWQPLKDAPGSPKYDKGSWIAYDGGNIIYAHKAKLHEFFPYYIAQDSWGGPLTGMPTSGSGGSKKAKDGSCATTNPSGVLYALKGGGTLETWQCTFTTDGSAWKEKDPIPIGGLKKKVKAGAGIVAVGTDLYCTKGNKSNEFWQYIPGATLAMPQQLPQRDGVMAEKTAIALGTALEPNPLTSGFAVLRYGLTKAGAANLIVYNVAGQVVMERTLVAGRRGVVNLDLRHLSNGVYLVKFSSQDFENSHKLVVQR